MNIDLKKKIGQGLLIFIWNESK